VGSGDSAGASSAAAGVSSAGASACVTVSVEELSHEHAIDTSITAEKAISDRLISVSRSAPRLP